MSDMRISGLAFDRGIDSIAYAGREAGGQQLPERQDLPPPAEGIRAQLAQLLDKPTTARYLDDCLRPVPGNRDLLMPGRFQHVLQSALDALGEAAEHAQAEGSDDARALNRAVRLLKDEAGLRDLVTMYRSALYQG
jgi:type III secretion protein X